MSKVETPRRIYVVESGGERMLIRAANGPQARNHAARSTFAVRLASQEDLVELVSAGVPIENAGADPELGPDPIIPPAPEKRAA